MQWLELLQSKAAELGRRQVEADLGVSKTTLSQVLNSKYPGNLENIQRLVLETYTHQMVQCPILEEISAKRCHSEQIRPFSASNPQRVALFRACQTCPNNRSKRP
ncbi:helix-turn-helix transcriptional regulator [Bowmanella denitrificans]|uniref:helix-turn-helix transcriptional regulator n=1 Tax=Bowmanella denitrificans TaxID=366582 RepID=UPI000C9A8F36|nr:helix-turn-helix transcriptional regulator [Bowmanella denitrificans]